jgi:hypothetical protein
LRCHLPPELPDAHKCLGAISLLHLPCPHPSHASGVGPFPLPEGERE